MGSASLHTSKTEPKALRSSDEDYRRGRSDVSRRFAARFRGVTDHDSSYWDYAAIKSNSNPFAYFQYPAMMVPRMQGDLLQAVLDVFPATKRTLDPFAGSGTILTESLKRGLSSIAIDVNPMAILLCKVKASGFRSEMSVIFQEVLDRSLRDHSEFIDTPYANREKWFSSTALIELSRVSRAIRTVKDDELRRFLWVAFAEAVRINSNSRTSTYKLHIRDIQDRERRQDGTRKRIEDSMGRVLNLYIANAKAFEDAAITKHGRFKASATVINHDMREPIFGKWADALISSPPYGDNHTTVTYGQHSFLPLQWIPLSDIDESLSTELVSHTHAIDSASLGGRKQEHQAKAEVVKSKSASLLKLLTDDRLDLDAKKRLVVFFFDLDVALANSVRLLRKGSPIVLTLGNRSVRSVRISTDIIVRELLEKMGCEFIDTHVRVIPTKRMAYRNKSAGTMLSETLLIMRSST